MVIKLWILSYFKKIDWLLSKSFVAPYLLSLLTAEFVLVMIFLWMQIDRILGKGVPVLDLLGMMGYFSISIMPKSIPISILLSSVFVFGKMGEHFELTSMKSSGMSFFRILRSGMFLAVFTAVFSIICSNILAPKSQYLFLQKFDTIKQQKAGLLLEAGKNNKDFSGYTIWVGDKSKDGSILYDVKIYDENNNDPSLINVVAAKKGEMVSDQDSRYLKMILTDGVQYRDLKDTPDATKRPVARHKLIRTEFEQWVKIFDMSQFDLNESSGRLIRNREDLMNIVQLSAGVDSVKRKIKQEYKKINQSFGGIFNVEDEQQTKYDSGDKFSKNIKNLNRKAKPSIQKKIKAEIRKLNFPKQKKYLDEVKAMRLLDYFNENEQNKLIKTAYSKSQRFGAHLATVRTKIRQDNYKIARLKLKFHEHFSWALMCIIFLFIGAPMGSIIRKGGYGYPLLVAILFFMLFEILQITGVKLLKSQSIGPVVAAWLPCFVIGPISALLTIMAIKDFHSFQPKELLKLFRFW